MKKKSRHIFFSKISLPILLGSICYSCIETFDFEEEIETFESALVIEATITNEFKPQEILLSRTIQLGEKGSLPESNAQVKVIDNFNTEYQFKESDSAGTYISTISFAAKHDYKYTLLITTTNGKEYNSSPTNLTQNTKMDSLYAVRDFNEEGVEGISIYVDSYDPTGNSKYYRHEFEETYKIIAPYWTDKDVIATDTTNYDVVEEGYHVTFLDRPREEQVCYNTMISNDINVINTLDFEEDRLDKYRIRFISRDNYIISHRYTINVSQYVQSREAQEYYKTLKLFSESESLLSENQPGFFAGNVFSLDNNKQKVLGYFEVSSVDTQRIYFNYDDFFPNEELPPYANGCFFDAPPLYNPYDPPSGSMFPLKDAILSGNYKYYGSHIPQSNLEGPVLLVTRSCGDCTVLGKTNPPDFWID